MSSRLSMILAVVVWAACTREAPAPPPPDTTTFHPPTATRALIIDDGGVTIDPHVQTVTPAEAEGAKYMCSQCYKQVSQAHIHVIPWFNDSLDNYVTTFRCDDDWLSSLAETRAHLLAHAESAADRTKFVDFFARHDVHGLDASDAAQFKRDAQALLDKIEQKQLVLSP